MALKAIRIKSDRESVARDCETRKNRYFKTSLPCQKFFNLQFRELNIQ